MKTTVALKVKLRFVHDNVFNNDGIERLIDRVYFVLKDCADCSSIGLCPKEAEGYTEEIEVSLIGNSEPEDRYKELLSQGLGPDEAAQQVDFEFGFEETG